MSSNLHSVLGGRDIASVIRSFSGSNPAVLDLDLQDLLGELTSMGYNPLTEITRLVNSLRREQTLKKKSQPFASVVDALNNMEEIVSWSVALRGNHRMLLTLQTSKKIEPMKMSMMLSGLFIYDPVIHPPNNNVIDIVLDGRRSPEPEKAIVDLYTSLVYLDSINRQGQTDIIHTSAWMNNEDIIDM